MANKATQFQPGNPGGGRPKGSPNRTTGQMKAIMKDLVDSRLEQLALDLDSMAPFQRAQILLKLNRVNMAELSKNENTDEVSGQIKISVSYDEPASTPDTLAEGE